MIVKVVVEKEITMEEIAKALVRRDYFIQKIDAEIENVLIDKYDVNSTNAEDATDILRMSDYIRLFRALADTLEKGDWRE